MVDGIPWNKFTLEDIINGKAGGLDIKVTRY